MELTTSCLSLSRILCIVALAEETEVPAKAESTAYASLTSHLNKNTKPLHPPCY